MIIAALSSAVMVGSVLPFLSVLAEPERIQTVPALKWVYDTGGFESDYQFLKLLGYASIGIILAANLIQIVRVWAVSRFALMRIHSLSLRLLSSYLRQPYELFLNRHSGDMGTKILDETQQVVKQYLLPATEAIASLLSIICVIAVLFIVDPIVASFAFVIVGGIYGGALLYSRRLVGRLGKIRANTNRARFRIAGESLSGIKDIKLAGRETAFVKRYSRPSRRMAITQVRANVIGQTPHYIMQVVAFSGVIAICLVLLEPDALASGSSLSAILPTLGVFAFSAQRLIPELSKFYRSLTRLTYGNAAVDAVHRDLNIGAATPLDYKQKELVRLGLSRALTLDNVGYSYPNAERPGLSGVSLEIRAGEKIGIVGGTGAGKTTLADLILGLLPPSKGQIRSDGTEIVPENLRAWQRTVGYVPQEIFLTDSSIAENIAFGLPKEEVEQDRVLKAARIAQIHEFILNDLPDGYDSAVGERGVRLSGGQRQRIGIARALYHDADLIVFDEATSALDNLTEREVMSAIRALPGDKTILMIAHRLSTVKECDRIVLMNRGQIEGLGSWSELASSSDEFRRLIASTEFA